MAQRRRNNRPWNGYKTGRKTGTKGEPKKRILIVCEGEKTEPNYFKAFRVTSAVIVVDGAGTDTKRVVSRAISLKANAKLFDEPYDQVWCIFDRDSFNARDFNDAFTLASENDIEIAYSNEAFELWYLLHFHFFNTAIARRLYNEKLTVLLGKKYQKNSKYMYEYLLEKQPQAVKHAKNLLRTYSPSNPERDNPSTTVFRLVEELNKNL